jgi:hypothetical protein
MSFALIFFAIHRNGKIRADQFRHRHSTGNKAAAIPVAKVFSVSWVSLEEYLADGERRLGTHAVGCSLALDEQRAIRDRRAQGGIAGR